jgi:hypothetical protein
MITYPLRCGNGHRYNAWFKNSEAFDKLRTSGLLSCDVCGTDRIVKELTAPRIAKGGRDRPAAEPEPPSGPAPEADDGIPSIETLFEDVGPGFATEMRAIHDGTAENRSICGRATGSELKELIEDGLGDRILARTPDDS